MGGVIAVIVFIQNRNTIFLSFASCFVVVITV